MMQKKIRIGCGAGFSGDRIEPAGHNTSHRIACRCFYTAHHGDPARHTKRTGVDDRGLHLAGQRAQHRRYEADGDKSDCRQAAV